MASSSSSSSSKRRRSYDVFLSFRGTDIRNNFLGHLYTALDQRGINTYMDGEELRTGEQISPALMEAIEESRIAMAIFSENYASSKWCLGELAKIMECKEQRDLMVFPVFYKVEPCEVRTPGKSYLEAMAKHEDKFGKDSEEVKGWKKALSGAGSLSGLHFTDGKHAFPRKRKIEIRSNLVDGVLHYAGGLPLALKVLGSFLCGREEDEWESTLEKLAKSPDKDINDVLKVGYEGLEDYAKEIFLDIACFFKGRSTSDIKKVLDSCGFHTTIGLKVLIERSWISEDNGTFQMHDLIQLMGRDIVEEECRDDPGKRSRLWLYDDVLDVLSRDLGAPAMKAIVLELPEREEMYIGTNAFTNMRKLRLLILRNVHNPFQGPIHFPNELRWFEWPKRASIPEFGDGQKKLVALDLRNTNIEVVLKQFQDYKKLKFINFSRCESVFSMPDLYCTPYLEELNLRGCKNLEHLPDVLRCKNLQFLGLSGCSKLRRFPDIPDEIKGLRELDLVGTAIEELPASIENFVSLEGLVVSNCKNLEILPSSIYRLGNLRALLLDGCSKLIHFPKAEEDWSNPHKQIGFPGLEVLSLRGCNLSEVEFLHQNHSCFPSLVQLSLSANVPTFKMNELDVSDCQGLQEILKFPEQSCYRDVHCKYLRKTPSDNCEWVHNGMTITDLFKLKAEDRRSVG
ncbi:TMV resistance protein N-like [Rhodamnia argentea]|uniref:TMV resistance protein N-like n=1 Tax=Rhodamnia argentea TaxID=178133 RepID=A0ABM3H7S6_9MYRT|nr:TMV resistance protein N-like [Rhodamnia argentea]